MTTAVWIFFVAATLLVAGLAFYAGTLLWQLRQQSKQAKQQLAEKKLRPLLPRPGGSQATTRATGAGLGRARKTRLATTR